MLEILSHIYHFTIMLAILGFGIICLVGAGGGCDNWISRLKQRPVTRARRWLKPDVNTVELDRHHWLNR